MSIKRVLFGLFLLKVTCVLSDPRALLPPDVSGLQLPSYDAEEFTALSEDPSLDFHRVCDNYGFRNTFRTVQSTSTCSSVLNCQDHRFIFGSRATRNHPKFCAQLRPPGKNTLILQSGSASTDAVLQGSWRNGEMDSTRIQFDWVRPPAPVNILGCAFDNIYNMNEYILRLGYFEGLPVLNVRVIFLLTITKTGIMKTDPNLSVRITFTPTEEQESLTANRMSLANCPNYSRVFPLTGNKKFKNRDTIVIALAVSIPRSIGKIDPNQFKVEFLCRNNLSSCNLRQYRMCAQIVCRQATNRQILHWQRLHHRLQEKIQEGMTQPSTTEATTTPVDLQDADIDQSTSTPLSTVVINDMGRKDLSAFPDV